MNAKPRAPSTGLIRVLLVADHTDDLRLVTDLLDSVPRTRFLIDGASSLAEGRDRLQRARFDVCLLDPGLPDGDGLDLLATAEMLGRMLPVVVLADSATVEQDRRAMIHGAAFLLEKGKLDPTTLERAIRYGIHQHRIVAGVARQALRDQATGLISPLLYRDRLNRALAFARRRDREVAVMMIDLAVAPSLAPEQEAFDDVLAEAGRRLAGALRETDSIARLAERRIGMLIEGIGTPDHAAMVAKKALRRLQKPIDVAGRTIAMVPSIGVAVYPREGGEGDALLRQAEGAMRRALAEGGGCCRFASARVDQEARAEMIKARAFTAAYGRRELRLRFHPELHVGDGRAGVAGELFWRHPDQGWLPLDEPLAHSDDHTLIKGIADWALAAAAEQLSAWEGEGLNLPRLALSLPFRHRPALPLLARAVLEQVRPRGVAAERIELDVDQQLVVEDARDGFADLAALKATGVRLALDGFGWGHARVQDLRSDLLDSLRLAPSLCAHPSADGRSERLIRALINLGHDLELAVTAKDARDQSQFALFKRLGCDAVRLAAFPPMNAAAAKAWLRTRPSGLGLAAAGRAPSSPETITPDERYVGRKEPTAQPLPPPD